MRLGKNKMRAILSVSYLLQLIAIFVAVLATPQILSCGVASLILLLVANSAFSFYLLDFKNVKGWWLRKIFEANQRMNLRKSIEIEYRRQMGLGYDKLERGKSHKN